MQTSCHANREIYSNYNIVGSVLEQVTSYKYLGVHIAANLSWHINYIVYIANQIMGIQVKSFLWFLL